MSRFAQYPALLEWQASENARTIARQQEEYGAEIDRLHGQIRSLEIALATVATQRDALARRIVLHVVGDEPIPMTKEEIRDAAS